MSSKEAKKYLTGHLGYIKIANVHTLTNKLFYSNTMNKKQKNKTERQVTKR